MTSMKVGETISKKRTKSQRLKKSLEVLLRPEPKSDRKNSSDVKYSFSHNNIKTKKQKQREKEKEKEKQKQKQRVMKNHDNDIVKIKPAPRVKTNNKQQKSNKSVNLVSLREELKNSSSEDIKTVEFQKNQKQKLQQQLQELKSELIQLKQRMSYNLQNKDEKKSETQRQKQKQIEQQEQISEIKSEKPIKKLQLQNQQEMEIMTHQIEELKSELLASKLQSEEYKVMTKNLMRIQQNGVSKSVILVKEIMLRKVNAALGRCFAHIADITVTNKNDGPRQVEKLLVELPSKIQQEFARELNI